MMEKIKTNGPKSFPMELFVSGAIPIANSSVVTHEVVLAKNSKLWYNRPEFVTYCLDCLKNLDNRNGYPSWFDTVVERPFRNTRSGPNEYKTARKTGNPQYVICFTITRKKSDIPLANLVQGMKAILHSMYTTPSHDEQASKFVDILVDSAPNLANFLARVGTNENWHQRHAIELSKSTSNLMKQMTKSAPDVTFDCSLDKFFMDDDIKQILLRNKHTDLSAFESKTMKCLLYRDGNVPNWEEMVYVQHDN